MLVVETEPIIAAQLAGTLGCSKLYCVVANNRIDAHYFGDDASRVFDAVISIRIAANGRADRPNAQEMARCRDGRCRY